MKSWHTTITCLFSRKPTKNSKFENVMRRASALETSSNLRGLQDLQKIILRSVQSAHICDAYLQDAHSATTELIWPDALGITCVIPWSQTNFSYHVTKYLHPPIQEQKHPLNLATDIILPTCWHPTSIITTLGMIGKNYPAGIFSQSANHKVTYVYPLGIGWVDGGNHSIAQGIIRGDGLLHQYSYVEIYDLIKHIRYNGLGWEVQNTKEHAGYPRYPEFGWAWEIGRMIAGLEGKL